VIRFKKHIALAFAVLISGMAHGQNADAVIDRNEILIGEQAVISLSYRVNKQNIPQVDFPVFKDTLVKNLEVLSSSPIDTLETGEGISETRLEQKLVITSFDSGYYAIPPFEFKVNGAIEKSPAFLLTVQSVEIDTTAGIKGEKPIYAIDLSPMDYVKAYWPYGAGVAGLVALAVIAFLLFRRYQSKPAVPKEIVVSEPKISPYDQATRDLVKFKKEKIYLNGKVKEFHIAITDTLRDYIDGTFQIRAHEYTSKQILDALRYAGIEEKQRTQLRTILLRADLVKFAKEKPDANDNENAVEQALEFVEKTRPEPDEKQEVNGE